MSHPTATVASFEFNPETDVAPLQPTREIIQSLSHNSKVEKTWSPTTPGIGLGSGHPELNQADNPGIDFAEPIHPNALILPPRPKVCSTLAKPKGRDSGHDTPIKSDKFDMVDKQHAQVRKHGANLKMQVQNERGHMQHA